jgi:copper resistance protein B
MKGERKAGPAITCTRDRAAGLVLVAVLLSAVTASAQDAAMDMGPMLGGSPPADARDPHAYSGGQDFGPGKLELADTRRLASLRVENLEAVRANGNTSVPYDLEAWYGRTYDRAVLKAEGDIDGGEIVEARTELLWGHAFAAFWDSQLGVRYDSGEGPNREWLAFGIEGLAPYWFDIEATAYLGESGRSALRLDASYDLLLTQKLVLQARIEANIYGKRDVERGLGNGLSAVSAALRVRYEIRRELAPYFGVEWVRKYGETEDFARAAGDDPSDARLVAGLRFWF